MDYGLYGLGSKSEHWAQIGSALFCKTIVLVSTKLLSVRIAGVSAGTRRDKIVDCRGDLGIGFAKWICALR
jgi:hypothetical protein